MRQITSCLTVFIICMTGMSCAQATIIRLDNTAGGLGALIDETGLSDLPFTVAVPGLTPAVNFTITDIQGAGPGRDANSTNVSFGVNSDGGGDDTDAFDSLFDESLTFQFDQDVDVASLDFTTFDATDVFNFAGQVITSGDLANGTTDVFNFSTPLRLAANTNFTISATSGTIGIEAFEITVVPEPSGVLLLSLAGAVFVWRQRRTQSTLSA